MPCQETNMSTMETNFGHINVLFTNGEEAVLSTQNENPIIYRKARLHVNLQIFLTSSVWMINREKSKVVKETGKPAKPSEIALVFTEVERLFPSYVKANEYDRCIAEEFSIRQSLLKIQASISEHECAIKKLVRERDYLRTKLEKKLTA